MSSTLPFGLSRVLRPLSPPLARTRLKSNLFALFLFTLRNVFPPFLALRAGLVKVADAVQGRKGREASYGDTVLYLLELLTNLVLLFNILEAVVAIQYPSTYTPAQPTGMKMTPVKVSSPLTRSYSPSKPSSASSSSASSQPSLSASQSQSLQRSIFRPNGSTNTTSSGGAPQTPTRNPSTPGPSNKLLTSTNSNSNLSPSKQTQRPVNASPLSSSTAKILNLSTSESPSKNSSGLFFDHSQGQGQGQQGQNGQSVGGDDFVLVDREEKEWVDNVWKGVRGKGGKVRL
ncbi:hypothetical protein I317_06262 [Kwoniella heveanensis CBS 569]|nr:hypothetical protein I317_06262 [Kwoniella heveanensis CBS 569]